MALDTYGRNLGIAFQLVDDAIDYASDEKTMGKDAGDDFRDGKVTLPVILAYARGNEEEKQFWRKAIAGHLTSDDDLSHATALLQKDRKSTRLNSSTNEHLVCRLLLAKKKQTKHAIIILQQQRLNYVEI